ASEGVQRIRTVRGGRMAGNVAPERRPERTPAAADHHRGPGVVHPGSDGPCGRCDGVVGRDLGRADEVQTVGCEARQQALQQGLHTLTSSTLLAYLSRSAPTTL